MVAHLLEGQIDPDRYWKVGLRRVKWKLNANFLNAVF
jgi:hypothetical protein